jgi:hypothetical protein
VTTKFRVPAIAARGASETACVRKTVTVVDVLAYSEVHGIPDDAAL